MPSHLSAGTTRLTTRPRAAGRAAVLTTTGLFVATTLVSGALTASPAGAAEAAGPTFVVTSTGDAPDAARNGVCATSTRVCTLRAALTEAAGASGHVTIRFALPGPLPATISPASRLPGLTNPSGVTLDGWSQPGSARNTSPLADNSRIGVQIMGKGPNTFDGIVITSPRNVIQGLAVYHFSKVISITGASATGNRVVGSHVCTNAAGTFAATRQISNGLGIFIDKASGAVVGAPGVENRNVISGCAHRGVTMSFLPSGGVGNKVQNNIIGLNPSGTAAVPNKSHGVDINYTRGNLIGGDGPQERNVISGNDGAGVEVSHSRNTRDNVVARNFIGSDLSGNAAPAFAGNGVWGVRMEGPYSCKTCTEAEWALPKEGTPGYNVVRDNIIVGNELGGMHIDKGQHHNTIEGNRIGVTANGARGANGRYGIRLEHGVHHNKIVNNEIAYNPVGIQSLPTGFAPQAAATATNDNTFSRNSIHDNTGLGIDLSPLGTVNTGRVGDPLVNRGIKVPLLTRATATSVSGTACAGCVVEVFRADIAGAGSAEGRTWLATGTASASGAFTVNVPGGGAVTATATDRNGSTSEFARSIVLGG